MSVDKLDETQTLSGKVKPSENAIVIPKQLCTPDFRFIKLFNPSSGKFGKCGKEPMEKNWQEENNYAYNDNLLQLHLNAGKNYGVLPKGLMCILDVDDIEAFNELDAQGIVKFKELFGDTFAVRSGHSSQNHGHYYFQTKYNLQEARKLVLEHPKTKAHLGEIYLSGARAFVAGPNSMHESGNRYEIINDAPIKAISVDDFTDFILNFVAIMDSGEQLQKRIPESFLNNCEESLITQKLGLRIEDLVGDTSGMTYLNDGEFQGSHPVHGSTTGHNFNFNTLKNVWKCFRCDSGGDPAVYLAVEYGIIDCSEAKQGVLSDKKIFSELISHMKCDPRFADKMSKLDLEYAKDTSESKFLETYASRHRTGKISQGIDLTDEERAILEKLDAEDSNSDANDEDLDVSIETTQSNSAKSELHHNNTNETNDIADSHDDTQSSCSDEQCAADKHKSKNSMENNPYKGNFEMKRRKAYGVDVSIKPDDSKAIIAMKKRDIFNPPSINEIKFDCRLEDDNFIMRYADYVCELTDAYHEYHYASAFMLLSMIANRNAVMKLRIGDIYSNLWCFILGTSSISRKTTSMKFAKKLANLINSEGKFPSDFTPEAMIEFLSDSPKRWCFKDEAGTLLAGFQKTYMQTTRDILCELYDNTDYSRTLRTKKDGENEFNIVDPYLTMFFATTFDSFRKYTQDIDVDSGLFPRFLFFIPRHTDREYFPIEPARREDEDNFDQLKNDLMARYKIMSSVPMPFEFTFTSDGWEFFQCWQRIREQQCDTRPNRAEKSAVSRLIIMAIKMAMLFTIGSTKFLETHSSRLRDYATGRALLRQVQIPTKYIVEACRQIDEYFYPAMIYMFEDAALDETNNDIVKIKLTLDRNGGKMSKTKLMRAVHMSTKTLNEALEALVVSKEIDMYQDKDSKSPRKTTWITTLRNDDDDTDFYIDYSDGKSDIESEQNARTKKAIERKPEKPQPIDF